MLTELIEKGDVTSKGLYAFLPVTDVLHPPLRLRVRRLTSEKRDENFRLIDTNVNIISCTRKVTFTARMPTIR